MLKHIGIFALGALTGYIVASRILTDKYENIIDEEIESVKEYYKNKTTISEKTNSTNASSTKEKKEEVNSPVVDGAEKISDYGVKREKTYTNYAGMYTSSSENEPVNAKEAEDEEVRPYIIHETEYGELDEYDIEVLTYYDDGILADDNDEIIHDVDSLVGSDNIQAMIDNGDNAVYVRNDAKKIDYEINKDNWKYRELYNLDPSEGVSDYSEEE